MSEQDHRKFIAIMEALCVSAKEHEDPALAEALGECALHASGGSECPMGQLILDDYLRTGKLPGAASVPLPGIIQDSSRRRSVQAQAAPPKREELINHIHNILKREAELKRDAAYVEALQACDHFRETGEPLSQSSDVCPLYRLLKAGKPAA